MEQDTIRVRIIELVDETGTPRAMLQADSQGMSGLIVHDARGTGTSATIGVHADGTPFLSLKKGQDNPSVFASVIDGVPVVNVVDENGEEATLSV
jgi:hypothetical protein